MTDAAESTAGQLIMVVEDEGIWALDMQEWIQRLGPYMTTVASTAEDALQRAAELRPELAILDVRLAGQMDGVELGKRLWQRHAIPVIYVSAYKEHSVVTPERSFPYVAFLNKPVDRDTLGSHIVQALANRR